MNVETSQSNTVRFCDLFFFYIENSQKLWLYIGFVILKWKTYDTCHTHMVSDLMTDVDAKRFVFNATFEFQALYYTCKLYTEWLLMLVTHKL